MRELGLTNQTKTIRVSNAVAVGTTTITSATVDTAGFEGVRFVALMGAITDGTPSLKVRQGQAANMSDGADLAGSGVTIAATDDNEMISSEIIRPTERYVDCQLVRGGATGAVIDGIIAELFGPKSAPVTQDAAFNNEVAVTPAEGTA